MRSLYLLLVLLSVCAAKAHADRDIVYAARYYAPPGSHWTSTFHIYRINPDGMGKTQITFGPDEQDSPQWSPDGKQIMFVAYPAKSDFAVLCRMDADGRHRRVLRPLGKDEDLPIVPPTPGYELENPDTARGDTSPHTLVDLKTGRRLVLPVPEHGNDDDAILPMPGKELVYAANNHNSEIGTDYLFYRLVPATGKLRYLTEGQFLAWVPGGSRFCVAPGKHTTPYEKRKHPYDLGWPDGHYRMVWSAPLYVRAASGGKMRQLTPRLSYVDGADWRKAK